MVGLTRIYLPSGCRNSIPPARPVILLLDGHSSHYNPEAIAIAAEEKIIIFCLPPHTTHVAQPLDVSFFGPLKQHWEKVCNDYMSDNPGRAVTKFQFSALFSQAWFQTINPATIISGFRKVGVCPFNATAIKLYTDVGDASDEIPSSSSGRSFHHDDNGIPNCIWVQLIMWRV